MQMRNFAIAAALLLAACAPREQQVGIGNERNDYKISPCASSGAPLLSGGGALWQASAPCKSVPLPETNSNDYLLGV